MVTFKSESKMFAPEEDMIVIVVEDENDQQQVKLENDQPIQYENDQVEYENDQEIEYEEEYQDDVVEMVLDEVTGEIISNNKNTSDPSWSVPSEENDSQNLNQSSISSDSHTVADTITSYTPGLKNPIKKSKHNGRGSKNIYSSKKKFKNKSPFHTKHRNRQLGLDEAHSFVKEVRETFPELAHNEEMLITHLAELMRTVKIPSIPEGYSKFIGGLYE